MARYIYADKFLEAQKDRCEGRVLIGNCTSNNNYLEYELEKYIEEDVQPVVHGGWVGDEDYEHMYGYYEAYKCSNCGSGVGYRSLYPYCPECGTKMKNGVTEEKRMRY